MRANQFLKKYSPFLIFSLVVAILIVGTITVFRAALFEVSRTDLTVYLRAAQAILNHENIYSVENVRHWHYVYLPLLAILMVPFTFLPLWLSAALWYLISIAALIGTSLGIASLFESKNQRFWIPLVCIIVALPPLLNTFTRGQLGAISLYLTLLPFLLDWRGKKFSAGFVLSFGIVLKMSPLLILPLYFLLQRNWRAIAGCICGGFIFGMIVPAIIFGPSLSWEYLNTYFHVIAEGAGDQARQSYLWGELFTPFASDNQSFYALLTRFYWKDEIYFLWKSNLGIRLANLSFMTLLVGATCWAYFLKFIHEPRTTNHEPRENKTKNNFVIFSLLSCVMLFTSPVTQPHHFTPVMLLGAAAFLNMRDNLSSKIYLGLAMLACLILSAVGMLDDDLALFGLQFFGALILWLAVFISGITKKDS